MTTKYAPPTDGGRQNLRFSRGKNFLKVGFKAPLQTCMLVSWRSVKGRWDALSE